MALAATGPPDSTYGPSDTHLRQGDRRDQRRYHRGRQPLCDTHDELRKPGVALVGSSFSPRAEADSSRK